MKKNSITLGQRAADTVAKTIGSWRFIILQSLLIAGWMIYNLMQNSRFDPYPFILLNLMLSMQAAYTGPLVMMSQNRQSEIDRKKAEEDYRVNRRAKAEIELVQQEILELKEWIAHNKNDANTNIDRVITRLEGVQESLDIVR